MIRNRYRKRAAFSGTVLVNSLESHSGLLKFEWTKNNCRLSSSTHVTNLHVSREGRSKKKHSGSTLVLYAHYFVVVKAAGY